jgi:predicted nucleic acid-binding Zn ribbon protein
MPIYLYRCGECTQTREYFVNSDQAPLRCNNDSCETPGRLTRVWDGQTVSSPKASGSSFPYTHNQSCPYHAIEKAAMIAAIGIIKKLHSGNK